MFQAPLSRIIDQCDGAVAAAIMGFDGISVETVNANAAGPDVSSVSMEFSFVLNQIRRASEILKVGQLREVAIRSSHLTFVVRVLSDDYFLALVLEPNGNFGKGRFLMRMVQESLRADLAAAEA